MNRAPSPAIIHVRLRCWVPWMAAGTLGGGRSRWAASAHPALAVQGGQAQPILRSIRVSPPCDAAVIAGLQVFCLQYLPWCYLCNVVCNSSVFMVVLSVGMWCLAAPHLPSLVLGGSPHKIFCEVPFAVSCVIRVYPVAVSAASAWTAQLVRPQDSLGCSTTSLVASACPAPVLVAWGGQTLVPWCSQGLVCAGWPGDVCWETHPVRLPFMGCVSEALFCLCRGTNIYHSFWGASEFQDTYHGFLYFLTFSIFLGGFFILLVREKHRKTLYRFLLAKKK